MSEARGNSGPVLTTARLDGRIAAPAEAAEMHAFFERNREFHAPFNPPTPPDFYSVAFWQKQTLRNHADWAAGTSARFSFWLRDSGELVGQCNLTNIVRGAFWACHLGYSIDVDHQNQGLMTEAVDAVVTFAFERLHMHRVMANFLPHNAASAAVLRKLGFEVEGHAKEYLLIDGRWQDHVLTSKINPSWRIPS